MGVPLGHKLKIIKRIKDMRKDKGMSVPESRQGQREQKNNVESNIRAYAKQDYEVLPEPNMSSGGVGTENEDKSQKTGGSNAKGVSLLEGGYDEAQSHNDFLEAL